MWEEVYSNNKVFYNKLNKQYGGNNSWVCPACTYINKEENQTCEMCETPKPTNVSAHSPVKIHLPPPEEKKEKYILLIDNVPTEIEILKIPGVGNCLFDAFITAFKQLNINQEIKTSQNFRDMIYDYVTQNKTILMDKHHMFEDYLNDLLENIKDDRKFVFSGFDYIIPIIHLMLNICIKVIKPLHPLDVKKYHEKPVEIDTNEEIYKAPCECTTYTISLFNLRTIDGAGHINNGHYDLILSRKNLHTDALYENVQFAQRRQSNKHICG